MRILSHLPRSRVTPRTAALRGSLALVLAFAWQALLPAAATAQATLLSASFDTDYDGFLYEDDAFGTSQPIYAAGAWVPFAGFGGTGALQVELGGVDANPVNDMSGGWSLTFNLAAAESGVAFTFRYKLDQSATYEYDEHTRLLVQVDGVPYGRGSKPYVDHIGGDGASTQGNSGTFLPTTDWQQHQVFLGNLAAGDHTIVLGGSNNKKDAADESSTATIDDFLLTSGNPVPGVGDRQALVNRLNSAQFAIDLESLASFGDRCRLSSCPGSPPNSFFDAQAWVASRLTAMGYTVQYHNSALNGGVSNLYATKVGSFHPDRMYIVSAHLDGRGGGGGYDDDGSGAALVLAAAQVFAGSDVQTDPSVRFIWWDKEETGLYGAGAYVQERRALQGTAGEPTWLGVIQHDMILYDHGAGTAGPTQSPYADLDVEWRAGTAAESSSRALALAWRFLNGTFATQYPATAYDYSTNTDDTPFQPYVASVSVRENRRSLTSGGNAEWINPNYHTTNDVAGSYSDLDLALGFDAVRSTVGTVAELAGTQLLAGAIVTTTALTSAPNPSTFGQSVTFTATVTSGSGVPAGTVTFTEGGTVWASGVAVDGAGNASFSTEALAVGSHTLTAAFTGGSGWGNSSGTNGGAPQVVNPAFGTMTFTSIAAHDGWVLESGETTNVGGSINATATTTSALRVGDDNKDRQYKSVVSFDTSSLPDGATILSATVRLLRGSLTGTNPFTTHGTCWADVQGGSGFSGSTALQTGDFQATATAVQAASLSNAAANGTWSEGILNAAGLAALDKTGTTQIRVYFSLDDNDDTGNDYLGYYSGDNATAANRPQLVVTYQ